jgi:hypothetical protein
MKNLIRHFLSILTQKRKRNRIELKFDLLIDDFLETCRDHHLVTRPRILRWINQFDEKSITIPDKILSELRYYSSSNLTRMTNELVDTVLATIDCDPNDLYFVPIGDAGSGSQSIARILRNNTLINRNNILNLYTLHATRQSDVVNKNIVFVDDFSGTGNTFKEWWDRIEPLILPLDANIGFAVIVLNQRAEAVLREIGNPIYHIDYLCERFNVFSNECSVFTENEKELISKYCTETGCKTAFRKGYGECGLMISFAHGCPNNSIPILWYNAKGWSNLFDRRN